MVSLRVALAVILAGLVGTVANSIIVAVLTTIPFTTLVLSPGRNAVAIAVAIVLPVIYAMMSGPAVAAVVALVALTVIPSVLAKLVFGAGASWLFVLGVNAVYALAAWATYLALGRPVGAR